MKDLSGRRYTRWLVLHPVEDRGTPARPRKAYLCRCSCPNATEKIVFAENLTSGKSKSCGCLKRERSSETKFVNLSGKRFGRLLVLERAPGKGRWKQTAFWCQCDCGKIVSVRAASLMRGETTSCGCARREMMQRTKRRHGHTVGRKPSLLYRMYRGMIRRCYSERDPGFADYGKRGITVCAEWLESFETYAADVAHVMGPRPSSRHTIDRIDNDKGYSPTNVHWATPTQQNRNKRSNRWHELNGERLLQVDWALRFGITGQKLSRWLNEGRTIVEIAAKVGYQPVALPKKPPVSVPRKPPVSVGAAPASLHTRKSS